MLRATWLEERSTAATPKSARAIDQAAYSGRKRRWR